MLQQQKQKQETVDGNLAVEYKRQSRFARGIAARAASSQRIGKKQLKISCSRKSLEFFKPEATFTKTLPAKLFWSTCTWYTSPKFDTRWITSFRTFSGHFPFSELTSNALAIWKHCVLIGAACRLAIIRWAAFEFPYPEPAAETRKNVPNEKTKRRHLPILLECTGRLRWPFWADSLALPSSHLDCGCFQSSIGAYHARARQCLINKRIREWRLTSLAALPFATILRMRLSPPKSKLCKCRIASSTPSQSTKVTKAVPEEPPEKPSLII